jgi:outer membrane protein TolC
MARRRSLFRAELDEAQTIGSHLVSLVRLYKALGGGWPGAPRAGAGTGPGTTEEQP